MVQPDLILFDLFHDDRIKKRDYMYNTDTLFRIDDGHIELLNKPYKLFSIVNDTVTSVNEHDDVSNIQQIFLQSLGIASVVLKEGQTLTIVEKALIKSLSTVEGTSLRVDQIECMYMYNDDIDKNTWEMLTSNNTTNIHMISTNESICIGFVYDKINVVHEAVTKSEIIDMFGKYMKKTSMGGVCVFTLVYDTEKMKCLYIDFSNRNQVPFDDSANGAIFNISDQKDTIGEQLQTFLTSYMQNNILELLGDKEQNIETTFITSAIDNIQENINFLVIY